jgi:hypothetical protein
MATPKGTRSQRFLLKSGDAVHIFSNPQAITLQLRHEVPTEVDIVATSFKASVVLTPADALAIAGELLTVAAVQVFTGCHIRGQGHPHADWDNAQIKDHVHRRHYSTKFPLLSSNRSFCRRISLLEPTSKLLANRPSKEF